jgi:dihydroxy-acid dehydratase
VVENRQVVPGMSKRSPEGRISFVSDKKRSYRSAAWFAKADKDGFGHRSWMRNQGLPSDVFDGRPVIGICNTWPELTPRNAHFRQIAGRVKPGVWKAGSFPLEFPLMSIGESIIRPTAILLRKPG